jgi:phosphoserine phosphatase
MFRQVSIPPGLRHELSDARIPEELSHSLLALEQRLQESPVERKIAVFDLDNTLLLGDIGDAVFASLIVKGHLPDARWNSYRRLLNSHRDAAYRSVVRAMAGLSGHQIQRITLDLLSGDEEYLELDHSYIPVPRAHPVMASIVQHLRATGYQVYVISASNELSARIAAWKLFGIPPFCVFGTRQAVRDRVLTDELLDPIPIGAGKVEVYRQFIGEIDPLVSGGDSLLDIPMMRLTDPRGFAVWVGEDRKSHEVARQHLGSDRTLQFLQRPVVLQFDEEGPDI